MSAPTATFSSGSGTITTTAEANGLLLAVNTKLKYPRVRFGFSGTFTSVVVAVRGRLNGLTNYYPVRAVNPTTSAVITDSTNISLTDSTNAAIEVDAGGCDYLEVWVVSGTPTSFTVEERTFDASSPLLNVVNLAVSGTQTYTGASTVNVSSATAFVVGPNGTTNPTLQIVTNVASEATGIKVTGAAAAGGVAVAATSSGTDEQLTIDAKGAGKLTLNATATGNIELKRNTDISTKNLITDTSTGTKIGTGATQKIGFWNATPIVQPAATGVTTAGFTAVNTSTAVAAASTFTGNSGSTAYTVSDIVANLKAAGLLAA